MANILPRTSLTQDTTSLVTLSVQRDYAKEAAFLKKTEALCDPGRLVQVSYESSALGLTEEARTQKLVQFCDGMHANYPAIKPGLGNMTFTNQAPN